MDPQEFIDTLYLALLGQEWTLPEIDAMDIMYYLKLLRQGVQPIAYIDEIL